MCGKRKADYGLGKNQPEGLRNYLQLTEAAAEQGFPEAMLQTAAIYERVTQPPDPVRAYAWYTVAARRGLKKLQDYNARVAPKLSPEEKIRAQELAEQLDVKTPKTRLLEFDGEQTCQPKAR